VGATYKQSFCNSLSHRKLWSYVNARLGAKRRTARSSKHHVSRVKTRKPGGKSRHAASCTEKEAVKYTVYQMDLAGSVVIGNRQMWLIIAGTMLAGRRAQSQSRGSVIRLRRWYQGKKSPFNKPYTCSTKPRCWRRRQRR